MAIHRRLGLCLFFVVGCSVGEPMGSNNGFSGGWSPSMDEPDDDGDGDDDGDTDDGDDGDSQTSTSGNDDADDGDDGTTSGGDEDSSTGESPLDDTSDSADPTFGDPDDGGDGGDSGDGGDPGGSQPASGPWSACPADGSCGPGLTCIYSELIVASLCVESCEPAGDPSSCSPSPGGTATVSCLPVNTSSYCVLDCSGGATCPNGMICHEEDGEFLCI